MLYIKGAGYQATLAIAWGDRGRYCLASPSPSSKNPALMLRAFPRLLLRHGAFQILQVLPRRRMLLVFQQVKHSAERDLAPESLLGMRVTDMSWKSEEPQKTAFIPEKALALHICQQAAYREPAFEGCDIEVEAYAVPRCH